MTKTTTKPQAADVRERPFCGSTDSFHERADYSSDYQVCNDCSARGPLVEAENAYDEEDGDDVMQRKAIAAWNKRAQPTPSAVGENVREALAGFVADLTNAGRNRDNMLSIDHDALRKRIDQARAALTTTTSSPINGEAVDRYPHFVGSIEAKVESYNQIHEDCLEMGYPSATEALEHLDELRTGTLAAPAPALREKVKGALWSFVNGVDEDTAGLPAATFLANRDDLLASHIAAALAQPQAIDAGEVRPEVAAFALLMERQLRANDHKPGWKSDTPQALMKRVEDECGELAGEIRQMQRVKWGPGKALGGWMRRNPLTGVEERGDGYENVPEPGYSEICVRAGREAADLANMAMMLADVCGQLFPRTRATTPADALSDGGGE